ncbi:hypothetical protein HRbin17_01702 [bacterium HR17]|jgi:hypothetical protein|uniref:Uncharacterized protein n=1 Tax=Candidatus Fervidibacter japonicus TaxID=2035412 RepID=A0A2H5XDC0_9BACT|nr:hypothetical protein HRbin17_01702 [bacterium HR17]
MAETQVKEAEKTAVKEKEGCGCGCEHEQAQTPKQEKKQEGCAEKSSCCG